MSKRYATKIKLAAAWALCLLVGSVQAWAAPDRDFGAETVEGDSIVPLPVDQVEERAKSETAAAGSASAATLQENRLKLSQILAEGLDAFGAGAVPVPRDGSIAGIKLYGMKPGSVFAGFGFAEGDILRSVGGEPLLKAGDLQRVLEEVLAKETVVLEIERDGKEIVVPITIAAPAPSVEAGTGEAEAADADMTTLLNVNDVEIAALVKTFSKLTKRNYIIDSNVKGKITIHLPSSVSIPEALRILDAVLLLKGFTTVPVEKNTYKVVNAKDARQTTIPLIKAPDDVPSDVMVTQLIRLKYISAADVQQLLSQFVSKDGVLNAFAGTNSLVLIDSAANIERLKELIKELDVPALDQDITIIPVIHAEAKDLAEKINDILGSEDKDAQSQPANQSRRAQVVNQALRNVDPNNPAAAATGGSTIERRALPLKIIPDERTNAIIVVADQELTLKVRALVEQLDTKLDQSSGRFWVYRLEHADAEDLSEILNALISGSSAPASSSGTTQGSSISRNRSNNSRDSSNRQDAAIRSTQALQQRNRELLQRQLNPAGAQAGEGKVNLEGEVSIAPDPATNSLIINAAKADYQRLKQVIEELDIKRRQVLVEATILEVTLNRQEGMGIELQGSTGTDDGGVVAQTNFGGLTNILTNPAALSDLTIAAASTGTLTLPGGLTIPSQALLVSAVSRLSNVNVLSTPTIMATDNEEAEIIVGENVPFVTNTSTDTSNIDNTFNSIERQDVGITLRITPQISTGDFVVMKIFVEISSVVEGTRNDENGPTTTIRTTETTVNVKDNQMVITGGLISDNETDSTRGVPFFQDIPVLGHWFKRQDERDVRTNLLVFITPKIVSDQYDARETTRARASNLEETIERLDMVPNRKEVLQNPALDRVHDAQITQPGSGPSTITPPTSTKTTGSGTVGGPREELAKTRTAERITRLLEEDNPGNAKFTIEPPIESKTKVMELRVRPKLPGVEENKPRVSIPPAEPLPPPVPSGETVGDTPATQARLAPAPLGNEPPLQPANVPASGTRSYLVFREVSDGAGTPRNLHFADSQKTLGLIILGDLAAPSTQFFKTGMTYRYVAEGTEYVFVCLGRYGSLEEAAVVHPPLQSLSTWNQLSPEAVLRLGKMGWIAG